MSAEADMEERRLKNLLSHLTLSCPCSSSSSSSLVGISSVLNVINKAEVSERRSKSQVISLDNAQWNSKHFIKDQKASKSISKSRSSSNIFESRQSGVMEERLLRGAWLHPRTPSSQDADAQSKAALLSKQSDSLSTSLKQSNNRDPSFREQLSHSFVPHSELTTRKQGCSLRSKTFSSEVEGESLCTQMNDRGVTLRTNVEGCNLNAADLAASEVSGMQSTSSTKFERVCSSPGAKDFKLETQCKSFSEVDGFQGGEVNQRLGITNDSKVFRVQTQVIIDSEIRGKGNYDKTVSAENQGSAKAPNTLQCSAEQNLVTCRDVHMADCQPVQVGTDTLGSMTLSRNNAMTGQRRCIVEDCIFCLIIQGQSPAFKLYEDEMCVCILDVNPLTHGHSLLIPKAHFPSLELTPPEVAAAMCATVPFISMAIMQATNCDSFNLLVNSGKAAGQVVFHTHFHIIPRRSGDNLWRSEDDSRRALPVGHETALLVQQIRHNLSNKCL